MSAYSQNTDAQRIDNRVILVFQTSYQYNKYIRKKETVRLSHKLTDICRVYYRYSVTIMLISSCVYFIYQVFKNRLSNKFLFELKKDNI